MGSATDSIARRTGFSSQSSRKGPHHPLTPAPGNLMASWGFYRLLHTCDKQVLMWAHIKTHRLKIHKECKQASKPASRKLMDLKATWLIISGYTIYLHTHNEVSSTQPEAPTWPVTFCCAFLAAEENILLTVQHCWTPALSLILFPSPRAKDHVPNAYMTSQGWYHHRLVQLCLSLSPLLQTPHT